MEKIINKGDGKTDQLQSFGDAFNSARDNIGPNIKNAVSETADRFSSYANEARNQMMAKGKDATRALDRQVHRSPWSYIAAASIAGLALGYYMVRRKQ